MKKCIAICLLLCLILTGCAHEHVEAPWNCSPLEHWYECEDCGEKIAEAHSTDAEDYCADCGYSIYDNGDGTFNIMTYDAWGATANDIWCEEDGAVLSEMYYESEYDENGNVLSSKSYSDGVLIHEAFYEIQEGEDFFNHYLTHEIIYDETTKTVTEYNPYMYETASRIYDHDDNLIAETVYEYEFDELGNVIYSAGYSNGAMTYEAAEMLGPDGVMYTEYIRYYSEGELAGEYTHEYEFSPDGDLLLVRDFVDGVLAAEGIYEPDEDGIYYLAAEVCYDEDGSITEEYHYDPDGNFIE